MNEIAGTTCILNGGSAHAKAARALIEQVCRDLGTRARVLVTRSEEELVSFARQAVKEKQSRVAAGGGDGTVNAVAGAAAGSDTALGVIPIGTLNHFAKDAGVPLDLEAAARNFFTGRVVKVDVGEVNGRVFVNNSGIGLYPHLVRVREDQQRHGHSKWVAFALAVGSVLRRYSRLRVRLHLSEADALERLAPFVFVGNNRYEVTGLEIGRRLSLNSGQLWVCMPPRPDRRHLIGMAWKMLTGRVSEHELNVVEIEELSVEPATPWVNVSMDGEVALMAAPIHYRIRPGALHVIVPSEEPPAPERTAGVRPDSEIR